MLFIVNNTRPASHVDMLNYLASISSLSMLMLLLTGFYSTRCLQNVF